LTPAALRPADVRRLQQTLGNRAVGQLLQRPPAPQAPAIQAKLLVNAPADAYEQEADRMADQVMRRPTVPRAGLPDVAAPAVMPSPAPAPVVRGAGEAGAAFEQQLRASRGPGQPLPPRLKEEFEAQFGTDFSGVRLHTDGRAAEMNQEIQARAFTHGHDIYLGPNHAHIQSAQAKPLLAHELTHVVQQRAASGRENRLIQRRVGFEFENTNIRLVKGDLDDYQTRLGQMKRQIDGQKLWESRFLGKKYPNLARKEAVIEGTYFTLEADDTAGSNVEFVLHGTRENERGQVKAGFTFQQRQEMITTAREAAVLAQKIDEKKEEPFYATELSNKAQKNVIVHKLSDYPYLFQATAGIRLDRITAVFSKPSEVFESGVFSADTVKRAKKAIEASGLPQEVRRIRLTNLLTLILTYIEGARRHTTNIKEITPMMARTDFGRLFSLLPQPTRSYFQEHPEQWVALVCTKPNQELVLPSEADDRSEVADPLNTSDTSSPLYNISTSEWLKGMLKGKDLLKGLDPDKSMGGLGKRTDPGNPKNKEELDRQPIFEFRHMQPAFPSTFEAYCRTFFDYVAKRNDEADVH